jgi:hypothetical protein
MLNEVKIFFENLTHFRQLLNEGVGQGSIVDAINKHKIVHIYYAGDDTVLKGYRTIKPYVLGHTANKDAIKRGEDYMLLRAWETAGNSDSKKMYYDQKGKGQYGWRLFRVDKITSFLPTGELFSTEKSKFPDPDAYNPNDSQMRGIVAAVEIVGDQPKTNVKGNVTQQQVQPSGDTSVFAGQKEKFQRFSNVAKKQRAATADEIEHLWGMVSQMRARGAKSKYYVVQNEHGDMVLKTENQLPNIDPDSVVGNLKDLYNKLVIEPQPVDNAFFKQVEGKMAKDNIAKENLNKKDFFKNR